MINAISAADIAFIISAADIAFIMSSSTSAWLLSSLECSPQKQNCRTLRFCFWAWIMWKMYNTTIIEFGFRMISWIIKTSCLCYLPQPSASADNTDLVLDISRYHAQPHPIIVYYQEAIFNARSSYRWLTFSAFEKNTLKFKKIFLSSYEKLKIN